MVDELSIPHTSEHKLYPYLNNIYSTHASVTQPYNILGEVSEGAV